MIMPKASTEERPRGLEEGHDQRGLKGETWPEKNRNAFKSDDFSPWME